MVLSKLTNALSRLSPKKRRAEKAREELRANAEKALRMKQEAEPAAHIPPHRTAHEGMRKDPSMADFDRSSGREAAFTPQLKRSRVARSGDAS
ncbi:hypothetical protein [Microvirga thermotolerans]|uniref:Uncharacterized protein n=1 Tax=Microvirga thermotolerans TaxID=2651334 RepID=A0A5P9JYY2_9HYPH|nr:hypothetical protein [Microvirga thermotolerans]QFU17817.1 hypothetical protein GDR74_17210 [Microvirga thermotolerans]